MSKSTLDKSLLDIISDPDGTNTRHAPHNATRRFTHAFVCAGSWDPRRQNEAVPHLLHHSPAGAVRGKTRDRGNRGSTPGLLSLHSYAKVPDLGFH